MVASPLSGRSIALVLAAALFAAGGRPASAQTLTAEVRLEVGGDVPHPITLAAADLAQLPRHALTVTEKDGAREV
jgi:hypothetical protein